MTSYIGSPTIQALKEQLPLYKERVKSSQQKEQRIEQLQHEIMLYKQRLYPHLKDDEIIKIHATVPIKEAIKKGLAEEQNLKQRKKILDDQFEQAKSSLEEAEWKIGELRNEALSDEERTALATEVSKRESLNPSHIKAEHQQLLSQIQTRKKEHKQEKKQRSLLFGCLTLLLLIGTVWFIIEQNWLLVFILIAGSILSFLQVKQVLAKEDPLIAHLLRRRQTLEQEITMLEENGASDHSLPEIMIKLEKDNKIRQDYHHEQLVHKQQERTYDQILKQYEEWEEDHFQSTENTSRIAGQLQVDKQATAEALLEAFDLIQHIQQLILKKRQELTELQIIKQELIQYENVVNKTMDACKIYSGSVEEAVYELFKLSSEEVIKNEKLLNVTERKNEAEEAINTIADKINFLKGEKHELLKNVGVENEDEFRKYAKVHHQREEITKQKIWVEKQLTTEKNIDLVSFQLGKKSGY